MPDDSNTSDNLLPQPASGGKPPKPPASIAAALSDAFPNDNERDIIMAKLMKMADQNSLKLRDIVKKAITDYIKGHDQ